jgi:uncharacterized membrane protein
VAASILMIVIVLAAGAGALASAQRVASGYGLPALAVITAVIALPLWITCDRFLLNLLPTVEWFDPKEPFAPYFLLYLPLCVLLAVPPAAVLIMIARSRTPSVRTSGPAEASEVQPCRR